MAYEVDFWYISQDACEISTDFTPFSEHEKESIYMKTSDFSKMIDAFTDPDLKRKAKAFDEIKEYVLSKNKDFEDRKDFVSNEEEFKYFETLQIANRSIINKCKQLEDE